MVDMIYGTLGNNMIEGVVMMYAFINLDDWINRQMDNWMIVDIGYVQVINDYTMISL